MCLPKKRKNKKTGQAVVRGMIILGIALIIVHYFIKFINSTGHTLTNSMPRFKKNFMNSSIIFFIHIHYFLYKYIFFF